MIVALATEDAQAIGEHIKEARQTAGLTQADLAERLGVSRVHIANYERGSKWPNVKMLVRICKALETSPDKILGF